ncbi:Uncharacterized protein AArcCO_2023 [Halalkaliarchaeum sp. AArc-CO]|uniref:hypothetical protein n=1 Tax=unclassified Halalkaliarchaeum TaxID=2678344 RepID=UPI00217D0DF7|nr:MULTISPECIES: hypothetical protein [unclassified Halalkaliarchaeum]MDR5671817.1 hypothetical protein [Halalkaliarchaeum sp. AArc-GB]UWG51319.1 Uncharacterized protein AArcCO_2023 [Halalkaliarchaeum sp. AArc-CO]
MRITPETVASERDWVRDRAPIVVPLINDTRTALGELFETDVGTVDREQYRREVATVFADGDCAVNVAGYVGLLRDLDIEGDYPGFVVDEILGRKLASTIAGGQPLALLAEATFHFADSHVHYAEPDVDDGRPDLDPGDDAAGLDDLDAALAAGFQTRLPGWKWRETESPFSVGG